MTLLKIQNFIYICLVFKVTLKPNFIHFKMLFIVIAITLLLHILETEACLVEKCNSKGVCKYNHFYILFINSCVPQFGAHTQGNAGGRRFGFGRACVWGWRYEAYLIT